MRRVPLALALLVLLTAACTFERRSPEDEETGRVERPRFGPAPSSPATSSGDSGETGETAAAAVEEAARALAAFQSDRRAGDASAARARLAPEAVLLRDGRSVEWRHGAPAGDSLLAPASALGQARRALHGRRVGEDVLFVLHYPSSRPGAGGFWETLLLTPADARGWRVLLLHRSRVP